MRKIIPLFVFALALSTAKASDSTINVELIRCEISPHRIIITSHYTRLTALKLPEKTASGFIMGTTGLRPWSETKTGWRKSGNVYSCIFAFTR